METYIELLIGNIICFKSFEIREMWNGWDIFSTCVHMLAIALCAWFMLLTIWFVTCKVKPLNKHKQAIRYNESLPIRQKAREKFV